MPHPKSSIEDLIAFLRDLGGRFHRYLDQDELGPTRAQRAQALREVIEHAAAFQTQFNALSASARSMIAAVSTDLFLFDRLLRSIP